MVYLLSSPILHFLDCGDKPENPDSSLTTKGYLLMMCCFFHSTLHRSFHIQMEESSPTVRNSTSAVTAMLRYLLSRLVFLSLVLLSLSNDGEPVLMKSDNNPLWDCTNMPAHPMPSTALSHAYLTINANAHTYAQTHSHANICTSTQCPEAY